MATSSDLTAPKNSGSLSQQQNDEAHLQSKLLSTYEATPTQPAVVSVFEKTYSTNNRVSLSTELPYSRLHLNESASFNFANRFQAKSPLRALTIDVNSDSSSFNNLESNRSGSYSATHNTADQHICTRNSLISSFNGNLSAKYSKTVETYKRPTINSPSKSPATSKSFAVNFPYSIPNSGSIKKSKILGNDIANSLLNSLSPNSLNIKKLGLKSYSQDRQKPLLQGFFDLKNELNSQVRRSSPSVRDSIETEPNASFGDKTDDCSQIEKGTETSLYSIFGPGGLNLKNHSQTPTGKKYLVPLPNHEPTKCSVKKNGIVKAYAANTNQGIVRNYNEDRVSIILNIMKPSSRVNEEWPKCSFFGIYDGHGGVACADFLRDNLHQYVIKEPSFPWNPKEALIQGFKAAENAFLEFALNGINGEHERSGSCALTILIVDDICYVANVGDSRAVMSGNGGVKIYPLTKDHKPDEEGELKRIVGAGGNIYQSQAPVLKQGSDKLNAKGQKMQFFLGPHRVYPGRLSVSRTFGDLEAKHPKFGGNPNVVIAVPDVKVFRVNPEHDFIILASDGIYDKLSSRDVIRKVWESTQEQVPNIHNQCGIAVENVLQESISRRTLDNITVVMICFENFRHKTSSQDESNKLERPSIATPDVDMNVEKSKGTSSRQSSNINSSGLNSFKSREVINTQSKNQIQEEDNSRHIISQEKPVKIQENSVLSSITNESKRPLSVTARTNPANEKQLDKRKQILKIKALVPISDVNLFDKKVLAKRTCSSQNNLLTNKTNDQVAVESKLLEFKKFE